MPIERKLVYVDGSGDHYEYDKGLQMIHQVDSGNEVFYFETTQDVEDLMEFLQWVKDQISE